MRHVQAMTPDVERSLLEIYTTRCRGVKSQALDRMLPPERTRFYAYGRQALAAAFRRVGVTPGDRVLLPGFICREVLSSVVAVGATPCFYEIDQSLCSNAEQLERARQPGVRAVVAVNYFGFPQPLDQIKAWCRAYGLPLIEDNAHGFLSQEGDVPLGHRGDIGIFSLRKTLVLPNGAALVDNRPDQTIDQEDEIFQKGAMGAEWRYRLKIGLKQVLKLGNLQSARAIVSAVRASRFLATGRSIPSLNAKWVMNVPQERVSLLALELLRQCNLSAERARRRDLYHKCATLFSGVLEVCPLFERLPKGVIPQGFPFRYVGSDPTRFRRFWWKSGIQILTWPGELPFPIQSHAPSHYRQVMLAQFIW